MSKENRCDGAKEETKSLESPKLFNDFNISSFNISFNAGKQSRELDKIQTMSKKKESVLQRSANRHHSRLDSLPFRLRSTNCFQFQFIIYRCLCLLMGLFSLLAVLTMELRADLLELLIRVCQKKKRTSQWSQAPLT